MGLPVTSPVTVASKGFLMRTWIIAAMAFPILTAVTPAPGADGPPAPTREFRGVWVSTVNNIDWPSKRGLPAAEQKSELLAIFDRARELRMNAVILQVRPCCDAIYPSRLDPWSTYLTGTQGTPPSPNYDPLQFAVEEAHRRGLELHAWFNPFRAGFVGAAGGVSPDHISRRRPDITRTYGKHLWLDPGEPGTQEYAQSVIADVLKRYDVDGIHFDDYFYPYIERDANKKAIPFPDDASYAKYQKSGGRLSRDDWRRDNVNRFIRETYALIKKEKPAVKFGVSPFGIWKSGVPAGTRGMTAYQELYADSLLWWKSGWLDYFAPQLYWPISAKEQSFPVLLAWWAGQNATKRHLWPGLFTSRTANGTARAYSPTEIVEQIAATRRQGNATGAIHFSARAIVRNQGGIADRLTTGPYAAPALVPASPWLDSQPPAQPRLTVERGPRGAVRAAWSGVGKEPAAVWVLYARQGGQWKFDVMPPQVTQFDLPGTGPDATTDVAVSAVDRAGNESPRAQMTAGR